MSAFVTLAPGFMVCSLPQEVMSMGGGSDIELSSDLKFQLQWSVKIRTLCEDLTEQERAELVLPRFPYKEEDIVQLVARIRDQKKKRSMFNSIRRLLSSRQVADSLPRDLQLLHKIENKDHLCFYMKYIPPGSFWLGKQSASEKPRPDSEKTHFQKPYAIAQHLVTNELWQQVMDSSPMKYLFSTPQQHPIANVSWFDCIEFCNKLSELENLEPAYVMDAHHADLVLCNFDSDGYRLPTDAEWEYAARGGEYHLYSGSDDPNKVAWYRDNSGHKLQDVGKKEANGFGLHDMSGLVSEWCWDWYKKYNSGWNVDPKGPLRGKSKVIRGGAWYYDSQKAQVRSRDGIIPDTKINRIGFRLCRSMVAS